MGVYCAKDQDGFYYKDGKKYDKRGYEVRKNEEGTTEFFNEDGFKVM